MRSVILKTIALIILLSSTLASQVPSITSFSPTSGPIGTSITISGANFNATATNNVVYFGAVKADVTNATATDLTVTVPTGATYAPITVTDTTTGLGCSSKYGFIVTFPSVQIINSGTFVRSDFSNDAVLPNSVKLADLDGDGKLDILQGNSEGQTTVKIGQNTSSPGNISFASFQNLISNNDPQNIGTGDLDGDGKFDVVVSNYGAGSGNTISLFRNISSSGTISFTSKNDLTTGLKPFGVAIGDLNGDGKPEIVVGSDWPTDSIFVFQNLSTKGSLSFSSRVNLKGTRPQFVQIGDMDGDSISDIVAANVNNDSVSIWLSQSNATITANTFSTKFNIYSFPPQGVALGDIDRDGKLDIIVINASSNVSVFRNTSSPGNLSFAPSSNMSTGSNPIELSIGDLDGDGKVDIANANEGSSNVYVFKNVSSIGNVNFNSAQIYAVGGSNPWDVIIGDIDGDKKPDIVSDNSQGSQISVFRNVIPPPVPTPPEAPQNLIAVAENGQITLKWQKNNESDFLRYRIYQSTSPNAGVQVDSTAGGITDTTKIITGLTNGVTYYFRIAAIDSLYNQSAYSNEVSTTPMFQSLHVSSTGSNSNDGSAQFPLAAVGDAMNKAAAGDTIKIGAGTWTENLTMNKPLIIRGGYAPGFSESQRNIHSYQTVWKAVTSPQVTDNQSCTFDGIVFDGSLGTAKAVNVTGGTTTITHCTIVNYFGSGNQGIVVNSGAGAVIKNNTIYNNQLAGGGVIFYSIVVHASANAGTTRIENNIIMLNDVGLDNNLSASIANYNCVYNNDFLNYDGTFNSPGANDINADPKFVYPAGGDFRLKGGSPCIDAGNPADPVGDEPAPNGGKINIGNLGGTSEASKTGVNPVTFVSTSGNDNNDGSIASPYRTITKALQSALGDTIKVAAGNYAEGIITTGYAVVRGGYGGDFLESSRIPAVNQTVIEAVSSTMWYDAFGVKLDGFVFDGKTNVAGTGLHLLGPANISHTVVKNVKNSPGYGMRVEANVSVINNTIYNNTHGVYLSSGASSVVKNNIIRGNGFGLNNSAASGIGSYNDYFNNSFNYTGTFTSPGAGDLALDPLQVNAAGGNFQLASNSPCINAGDPAVQYNDPDGSRNDIGAYRFQDFPPGVPSNFTFTPLVNYRVLLKWRQNTDADFLRYRIYSGTDGIVFNQIDSNTTASDTTSLLGPLLLDGMYYFRVTALDNGLNESSPAAANVYLSSRLNDSLALVEFFDSTGGANWTNKTNWKTGNPLETWFGVSVSNNRVSQINLPDNNLIGTIPQSIATLTGLIYLNLPKNQFNGAFPKQICSLTGLTQLYLSECFISGNIPPEIGNLTNLTALHLYSNQLTGTIPPQIGNLTNLTILFLYNTSLSGSIPSSIGNLTNLTHLYLLNNQLSGSIPSEIGNLSNILELILHTNQLTGTIPSQLGNLSNLQELYLLNNKLSGAVPNSLTGLSELKKLYLSSNDLTDLPDFSTATSLENLEIDNNQFTFEDIEPNIGAPSQSFVYSPQDSVGIQKDTTVNLNAALAFTVTVGGANNQYQWYKDGTLIGGATNSSYSIASAQASDDGQYICRITNTVATALTLYSRPFNLTVTVIAPSITAGSLQVSNANPAPGTSVTISVPVTGSAPTVKLFHGKPGQSPGDSTLMTFNGSAYTATISGTGVTQEGLWFRIRAHNTAGVVYYPASGVQTIAVQITNFSPIKTISAYPNGVGSGGYFTIGLSFNGTLNLTDYFGAQEFAGDGNPSNWRLQSFNSSTQSFSDVSSMTSGNAYGLYHKTGTPEDLFSSVSSPTAIASDAFNNTILKPGWNLIAWPYTFTANVTAKDAAKIGQIWWMNGNSGWETVSQLKPYGGYMIRNKTAGDITVGSAVTWTRAAGKSITDDLTSSIRFMAESGEYRDSYNYVGTKEAAANDYDDLDELEPLVMAGGVHAYFVNTSSEAVRDLSYDIRSASEPGHVWDLVVENNTSQKQTRLSWEYEAGIQKVILFDITHNKKTELEKSLGYAFDNARPARFKIIAGEANWVNDHVQEIEASLPKEFSLSQNYPNPFNPSTTIKFDVARSSSVRIKIYNILGQEVTTLVNGYYETGRNYQAVWNGKDVLGREVASGVYIYRLEAGKISKVKKMLFVK